MLICSIINTVESIITEDISMTELTVAMFCGLLAIMLFLSTLQKCTWQILLANPRSVLGLSVWNFVSQLGWTCRIHTLRAGWLGHFDKSWKSRYFCWSRGGHRRGCGTLSTAINIRVSG